MAKQIKQSSMVKKVRAMSPLRKEVMTYARSMVANFLATRALLPFGRGSTQIDQDELDLNKECRYPENPDVFLFRSLIEREGIAQRINDVYPDESWSEYPELYQTENDRVTTFESRWADFLDEMNPWAMLHRVDKLSGWGRFGVLLMGIDDGRDLASPVRGIRNDGTRRKDAPEHNVIYMRPFSEDLVEILRFEEDKTNPRYGQPTLYRIKVMDPRYSGSSTQSGVSGLRTDSSNLTDLTVHWTRVLHVADNRTNSEWAGTPRLLPVCNRVYDLRKILGSSAEMFFKGGFPGYTFVTNPDLAGNVEIDDESIREELEDYMNGLKRYLASVGGEFKAIMMQVADPANHVLQQLDNISATIGTPRRILMGSEAGHLASTTDVGTWNRRLGRRQRTYLNPYIIKPFVNRLMMYGTLPKIKKFKIEWRDLNSMTDIDKSKIALTKSQAMMQYVSGKVESMMPLKQYFTMVLGMSEAEATAVITARKENKEIMTKMAWDAVASKPQGGGRTGNAPKKAGGRPSR